MNNRLTLATLFDYCNPKCLAVCLGYDSYILYVDEYLVAKTKDWR